MTGRGFQWRAMHDGDLDAVSAIAGRVHPKLFEAPEIFAEKLALYPTGCRILDRDGEPSGYLFAHPWERYSIPPLNARLGAVPSAPATLYVHDLALLPSARGTGAAAAVVVDLVALATGNDLPTMSLVAVNRSSAFWSRHEFAAHSVPHLAHKLRAYEAWAHFMVRDLRR